MTKSLISGFLGAARGDPTRPALVVDGTAYSYGELARRAGHLAELIRSSEDEGRPLAAVLAHRSEAAFASVLGVLASGKGYVPVNPKFPADRILHILRSAEVEVLLVGREGEDRLGEILEGTDSRLTVILTDESDPGKFRDAARGKHLVGVDPTDPSSDIPPDPQSSVGDLAYLLFTSGSTGEPKGVPITHENALAYVEHTVERLAVEPSDRFSQMHDLTFDFSVHDLWVCWAGGASLHCVPERALFAPAKFIRMQELTHWASVPSVVALMKKMGMLKAGAFPSIRRTVFCGEALPLESARAWQEAAPNCVIENIYGPTEATVAITAYPWDSGSSPDECAHGIVPIGWPFPGQECRLVDEEGEEVEVGAAGELCLAGSQVSEGYWKAPVLTAEKFVTFPDHGLDHEELVWYRTGDLARRDSSGCLHFVGRIDHQVKIRGYRVELQEIDSVVRNEFDLDQVASVAWPVTDGSADGVVVFTSGRDPVPESDVVAACRDRLPGYMVPHRVVHVEQMPLNRNQKIDRIRLTKMLEQREISP